MSCKLYVISIGSKNDMFREAIDYYKGLLARYISVSLTIVKPIEGNYTNQEQLLLQQDKSLQKVLVKNAYVVALSQEGVAVSSEKFAFLLDQWIVCAKPVVFVIGHAFGLSQSFKSECNRIMSFSPMTFPHRLSLVLLFEQLYRAFTIIKAHPYHKQ